jgi:hypothetical protein
MPASLDAITDILSSEGLQYPHAKTEMPARLMGPKCLWILREENDESQVQPQFLVFSSGCAAPRKEDAMVKIKRTYDPASPGDGKRIYLDR